MRAFLLLLFKVVTYFQRSFLAVGQVRAMATNWLAHLAAAEAAEAAEDDEEAQLSSQESWAPPSVVEIQWNQNLVAEDEQQPSTQHISTHLNEKYYPKQPPSWNETEILSDGLLFAGFKLKRLQSNNIRRRGEWFKSFYGVPHTTATPYLADLRMYYPHVEYKLCFLTMNWLCLYDTYPVLSGRWGYSEEYIGEKVMEYSSLMAKLARTKIIFKLEYDIELGRSIDTASFMIHEMRLNPHSKWFDWKTHSCGLVSLTEAQLFVTP